MVDAITELTKVTLDPEFKRDISDATYTMFLIKYPILSNTKTKRLLISYGLWLDQYKKDSKPGVRQIANDR